MLEMAGRIFAARGFHEASMDEIAEAAGVSKPMLYNYFGSKEGLYFAYVELSYQELITAIDEAVAGAGDGPARMLQAGAIAYYTYVGQHRDAFYVLFREMGDPGGAISRQRRRLSRRVTAALSEIVDERMSPLGVAALAEAYLGAARSLANWWLDHPEVPAEAIACRLTDFALGGLTGPAANMEGDLDRTLLTGNITGQ
jgi:AcrR family transcriptional regulator